MMNTETVDTPRNRFERTEITTVTVAGTVTGCNNLPFDVQAISREDRWEVAVADYDGHYCAFASFSSETEMMEHMDAFLDAVMEAYPLKEGKYGNAPEWTVTDGILGRKPLTAEKYYSLSYP